MIVLDAGAWALALTSADPAADAARDVLSGDDQWILPAHGTVETLRTIRRLEAHGYLSSEDATAAVEEICGAETITAPAEPWLLRDIWSLRHNVSPYDAAYVAVARRFECPLVTIDERLARASAQLGVTATVPRAR